MVLTPYDAGPDRSRARGRNRLPCVNVELAAMPKITAILHACNDAQRIGRALESLRAFDEILVIDYASTDDTQSIARHYGATVRQAVPGVNQGMYAADARHDWVFCLLPNESVSESLEASLFEWKDRLDGPLNQAERGAKAALNETFAVGVR